MTWAQSREKVMHQTHRYWQRKRKRGRRRKRRRGRRRRGKAKRKEWKEMKDKVGKAGD